MDVSLLMKSHEKSLSKIFRIELFSLRPSKISELGLLYFFLSDPQKHFSMKGSE